MNSASGRTHSCGHTHAARDAVRGSFDRKTGTVGIGVADVAAGVVIGLAAILAATPSTIVKQQVLVNSGNDDCQSGQFEFFDTQTLSLSASEAAAYVGQPIGIIFGFSPAPGLIGDQANIDNVSLNASTIPAPATLALLLAGVLGPAVTARRRRAQAPR